MRRYDGPFRLANFRVPPPRRYWRNRITALRIRYQLYNSVGDAFMVAQRRTHAYLNISDIRGHTLALPPAYHLDQPTAQVAVIRKVHRHNQNALRTRLRTKVQRLGQRWRGLVHKSTDHCLSSARALKPVDQRRQLLFRGLAVPASAK